MTLQRKKKPDFPVNILVSMEDAGTFLGPRASNHNGLAKEKLSSLKKPELCKLPVLYIYIYIYACVCVCEFLKILELTICFISSINFPAKFAAPGLRGRSQFLPPTAPFYATGQYTN